MEDRGVISNIAFRKHIPDHYGRCGFYLDFDGTSFGAVGRALDELRSWWRGSLEYISHSWDAEIGSSGSSVRFSATVLLLFEEEVTVDYYDESLRASGVIDKLKQLIAGGEISSVKETLPEPQKEERRLGAYSLMIE